MSELFALHAGDVRVEIAGAPPATRDVIAAVWGNAAPFLAPRVVVHIDVTGDGEVRVDGELLERAEAPIDLPGLVEGAIYDALDRRGPSALIHAGAVAFGDRVIALVGDSGAGKSTLALALLEQGAAYLTDELFVCDGARVWGIPRAIQFDPVTPGASMPVHLARAELDVYPARSRRGAHSLPLVRVPRDRVALRTYDAARVELVFIERGASSSLREVDPLQALKQLLGAVRGEAIVRLDALLRSGPRALAWSDPAEAAALLARPPASLARGA
jgi:hypothetical protein